VNATTLFPARLLPALLAAAGLNALPAQAQVPVQWPTAAGGNGNWYLYVSAGIFQGISFDAARSVALGSTHLGLPGYLATVTSPQEQAFLNSTFQYVFGFGGTSTAWLGASDGVVEGQWRWLDGPEAGQLVSYTNWRLNHPVNQPGAEDFDLLALSIVATSPPTTYGWVSLPPGDRAIGYIVEYGSGSAPIPEPATGAMLAAGLAALGWMARRRRGALGG
jgi:hypothetical protein